MEAASEESITVLAQGTRLVEAAWWAWVWIGVEHVGHLAACALVAVFAVRLDRCAPCEEDAAAAPELRGGHPPVLVYEIH